MFTGSFCHKITCKNLRSFNARCLLQHKNRLKKLNLQQMNEKENFLILISGSGIYSLPPLPNMRVRAAAPCPSPHLTSRAHTINLFVINFSLCNEIFLKMAMRGKWTIISVWILFRYPEKLQLRMKSISIVYKIDGSTREVFHRSFFI